MYLLLIADATTLTERVMLVKNVENIIQKFCRIVIMMLKRPQRGIVYIDEIDKISKESLTTHRLLGCFLVKVFQQALLKLIEARLLSVPPQGGVHPQQEFCKVEYVKYILFICGGAFAGLGRVYQ